MTLQERAILEGELAAVNQRIEQTKSDRDGLLRKLEMQAKAIKDHIDSVELRSKIHSANVDATPPVDQLSNELHAANNETKRLEAELRAARAETRNVQQNLDVLATEIARPLLELPRPGIPANQEAQPPGAGVGGTGGNPRSGGGSGPTAPPGANPLVPTTIVSLRSSPPLFATIAGKGSRVTMVDPMTKRKSTYRPPEDRITTVTPFDVGNDLFPLEMIAPRVSQLAIFDRLVWSWATLDVGGSVTSASPNVGSGITLKSGGLIGFTLSGPEITKLVAFNPWTREWVSQDLKEPASGQLTPSIYPEILICPLGRHFYTYCIPAKKWANLELKQPVNWSQFDRNHALKDGKIIVPEEDAIHTLDIKTGEWTHIDTKDDK